MRLFKVICHNYFFYFNKFSTNVLSALVIFTKTKTDSFLQCNSNLNFCQSCVFDAGLLSKILLRQNLFFRYFFMFSPMFKINKENKIKKSPLLTKIKFESTFFMFFGGLPFRFRFLARWEPERKGRFQVFLWRKILKIIHILLSHYSIISQHQDTCQSPKSFPDCILTIARIRK